MVACGLHAAPNGLTRGPPTPTLGAAPHHCSLAAAASLWVPPPSSAFWFLLLSLWVRQHIVSCGAEGAYSQEVWEDLGSLCGAGMRALCRVA